MDKKEKKNSTLFQRDHTLPLRLGLDAWVIVYKPRA